MFKKSITILILLSFITSCQSTKSKIEDLEYGKPVIVTLAWNNIIYQVTDKEINKDSIGKSLGKVEKEVSPKPVHNGEIARNTPEGPKIVGGSGNIYSINKESVKLKVAIELSPNRFFECKKYTNLK